VNYRPPIEVVASWSR